MKHRVFKKIVKYLQRQKRSKLSYWCTYFLKMIVERQTSSLVASYFTSMSTPIRVTRQHLTLTRRFKILRKERKNVTSNIIRWITQMKYTTNPGVPRRIKIRCREKMTRFLGSTLKTQIHIERIRRLTICKTFSVSQQTKLAKSCTVATLRNLNKS